MSSILTSTELIRSIRRRAFIPESQETFTNDDFLEMATEEVNISLMDQIMTARGDYLVYFEDVELTEGNREYDIPARAHGNKLRDAVIVDANGDAVKEVTQITLEEVSDYDGEFAFETRFASFYIQNNKIILTKSAFVSGDSLRMYFYMRPNKLVQNSRAATVTTKTNIFEQDTVAPKSGSISSISTSSVITSASHGLTTGDKIIITGTDSTPAVDGTYAVTVIDGNSFSVAETITIAGSSGSWVLAAEVVVLTSTLLPKHFTTSLLYDVVGAVSPNKIKLYDLQPNSINNAQKTISFRIADVGTNIIVGDYITKAEETIVPNLPTEYHPVLAQMTAVACLEAMQDEQGKQSAERKLIKMQKSVLNIVTNRVEGAPKKIKNRTGTLNQVFNNRTIRRRG